MTAAPSSSNALAALRASLPNCIQTYTLFDATGGAETTQIDSDKPVTTKPEDDKLAVDIVAIYVSGGKTEAEQISIFDSKKQPTTQKSSKGNPSDPRDTKTQAQQTDTPQTKVGKAPDAPQPGKVNWLADKDMIRNYLSVARIIGFGLDLKSLNVMMQTYNSSIDFAFIASAIGQKLQDKRKNCDLRPVVFIGHGYGTLLIERLLNADLIKKELVDLTADLLKNTAAVGFFAAPFASIDPLIEWSSGCLKINKGAKVFTNLQVSVGPEVWKAFSDHIAQWYMLTFAFQEKEKKKEKEEEEKGGPVHRLDGLKESEVMIYLADKIWEREDNMDDMARISGPQDPKFRDMTDYLTRAIQTHHLLAAAKRGDKEMITQLADQSINVNLPNRQGETALHVAVRYDKLDTIKALLGTGKVVLDQQDKSEMTALQSAVRLNGTSVYGIVKELLEAGASPNLTDSPEPETPAELAERPNNESTPRQPTGEKGKEPAVESPQSRRQRTKELLENPPPVSPPRLMKELIKETPTDNLLDACRKTVVVVREMFDTGNYIPFYTDIEQLIYKKSSADDKKPDDKGPDGKGPDGKGQDDERLDVRLDKYFIDRMRDTSLENKSAMCRWYHIPMNNMAWVHDLFATLDRHVWPWPQGYRNYTLPYSRNVYPQAAWLKFLGEKPKPDADGPTVFAIMMPYISYEEYGRQTTISGLIKKVGLQSRDEKVEWEMFERRHLRRRHSGILGKWFWRLAGVSSHDSYEYGRRYLRELEFRNGDSEDNIKGGTCEAIKAYLNYKHTLEYVRDLPLHPRRTLDQSYYYMLNDTSFRDKTQVVSRWFRRSRRSNRRPRRYMRWLGDEEPHNILMVDQLWLWVIQHHGSPDTVITSFPSREGANPSAVDDLQRQILEDVSRDPFGETYSLVGHILAVCCRTLSPNQDEESVKFLQFFENSIAHVEEKAFQLFQEFRLLSMVLQKLKENQPEYRKRRRILLGELLDISKESKPLTEVKDILDEIKIIQTTLEDQEIVVNSEEVRGPQHRGGWYSIEKARDILSRASRSFGILKTRAEEVEKSIEHLLDLKQKQANLWEARTSREGAEETAIQGNTLLVFTVVTIIFLPLSFMASFFALAIDKFPKDADGNTSWPLNYICGLLFGISFAVSIPFIMFAFLINPFRNGWIRFRYFWVNILVLPVLHLLSRVPILYGVCDNLWDRAADSTDKYDPDYESRVRKLFGQDALDREPDEDMYYLFDKRMRHFIYSGRFGGLQEDLEEDESE